MKYFIYLFICIIAFTLPLKAQQTLKLSRQEAETMFLQNNLHLISEKLNIESQKAEVIQAKLWQNPSFTINDINLWATKRQTGGEEVSPPFWNNFGRNQQIAFQLEQLVQTAGKRKKLIAIEQIDLAKAEQYFSDLLRNLKLELRNQLTELQYVQHSIKIHQKLVENIRKLTQAYKNQIDKGNISKAEYMRLKAQELQIEKEILDLTQQSDEIQKELKVLLRTDPAASIELTNEGFVKNTEVYQSTFIEQIVENAKQNRPDYRISMLEEEYGNKLLAYEKAQRVPDLNFGVTYDRNGNTMLDFVGFGVSFDLPIFNRNKGNIKKAKIYIEKAKIQKQQTEISIENEIVLAWNSLQKSIDFLDKIDTDYQQNLDIILEGYTKNFTTRNVSLLEYFDFINAYLENKKIILETQKDVNQKAEELNHATGMDLPKFNY